MSIQPKKSLGQNFLKDKNIAQKIVHSLQANQDDLIVEIGPGTGALTEYIYPRFPNYVAIELDKRAIEFLNETYPNLSIIESDVLKVNFESLKTKDNQRIFVIGNIPYYITSPILFHLFDQSKAIHQAVIMMQLEVAQRLTAVPRNKDYGILTIQTEFFSQAEILFKVPKQVFFPIPNVDSAVVSFFMKKNIETNLIKPLKLIVRTAFNQRRKKLSNALKPVLSENFSIEPWADKRAEELTTQDFVKLATLFSEQNS